MPTDWSLVRELMNAAIDACEAAERLELREADRGIRTGTGATVWDVMTSAWTYPESVRYAVIRARHDVGDDAPYRPELARPIAAAAEVCAELVGATKLDVEAVTSARSAGTIRQQIEALAGWYRKHMIEQLEQADRARR